MQRTSKTSAFVVALTAAALLLGYWLGSGAREAPTETAAAAASAPEEPTVWTCSMHPQVRLPEPGQCPICFMDLIPLHELGASEAGSRTLTLSPAAVKLAEITTVAVERRLVAHEVRMVGKVAYDETRTRYLTAWVPGRLDRLFVDYTGVKVRKGDHMVEIYSPELYSAQQELLLAIRSAERLRTESLDSLRSVSEETVRAAASKLRLLGLTEEQVQAVVERGTADDHMVINAPMGGVVVHKDAREGMYVEEGSRIYTIADLSKVWVLLDAYETDLAWLRYGQDVEFEVEAYPGERFHGRIAFIDPVLDDRTRTVKIRVDVPNEHGRLKPDMFVRATVQAILSPHGKVVDPSLAGKWMCPMHPEVLADGPGACPECGMDLVPVRELGFVAEAPQAPPLLIPASAPLITGKRAIVYVRVPDRERPTFEGREIRLGPRAGAWYVVHEGLSEGEEVVTNGNFKLDSELQIRAQPSMMSPEADGAAPSVKAPAAFRAALGRLADAYLETQEALAADDEEGSRSAAERLPAALAEADMTLLDAEARSAWRTALAGLAAALDSLAEAPGLDLRRERLGPASRELIRALRTFGYAREGELAVFHCPMALDGAGADWVQAGGATANPYLGSAMLRCGDFTEALEMEP